MSKKLVAIFSLTTLSILLPISTFAVYIQDDNFSQPSGNVPGIGQGEVGPFVIWLNWIINFLVWPIVVAAVIITFMMAGFIYLTAQGEPSKISTANKAVAWGVVGVIIIIVAFSIISTVNWLLGQ